ncbi:MAG: acyl-CoA desaturase [Gemmatimonadota bacterium]|nr:acyl-CoA desaturase [Gemmatimonadota bacterium]
MKDLLTGTVRFDAEHHDDIVYPDAIPFLLVHLATIGILWSGVTTASVLLCVGLYVGRMISITAGFHRYFSHRSFRTSRVFQFVLAFLSQTSLQKGVLWWSAKHRHHHKHSDTVHDVHSPGVHGFFFAHVGWIFSRERGTADYDLVKDLSRYPELRWLDRHEHLPGILLATACFLVAGWPGLFVGFFLSTAFLYHGTFAINSLAHTFGKQRYLTGDDSRNSWFLALLTGGEGWHNNHHYYQASTRQGWRWYEIDITYYVLKALSWVGIVWDLKAPPEEVVAGERRLPRTAIDKVAHRLADRVPVERIAERIRQARESVPDVTEVKAGGTRARERVERALEQLHRPDLPTVEDLKRRAEELAPRTPSVDDVAERAREIVIQAVAARLVEPTSSAV